MSEERTASALAKNQEHGGYETESDRPAALNVGHQLRLAREARGVSIDEASAALKLSPRQVEALEANEWSHLPKTIIRGFVRNYARYLDLDAAQFMAALDSMPLPKGPELAVQVGAPVSMPREGRVDRRDYVRVFAGLVALILAISAYFFVPAEMWRSTLDSIKELAQTKKAATEMVPEPPAAKESGTDSRANVAAPELTPVPDTVVSGPAAPASSAVTAPALVEQSSTPTAPSPSSDLLVFSFAQPSWVEVRDRSGQVVFSQLSQAGTRREVSGHPPFSLVVGNASHVTLQYKGKSVDLSKRSKDDVARLTLE